MIIGFGWKIRENACSCLRNENRASKTCVFFGLHHWGSGGVGWWRRSTFPCTLHTCLMLRNTCYALEICKTHQKVDLQWRFPGRRVVFAKFTLPGKRTKRFQLYKYDLLTHTIDILEIINIDTSTIHVCTVQSICRLKRGYCVAFKKDSLTVYVVVSLYGSGAWCP